MNCASCDAPSPPGARFCPSCGTPLAPAASATQERKLVTVVFCDLVGSTELSETLDPETLRSVTLRYFSAMETHIDRYGGTVEKFIGDAVMAVFGVPAMHEDDAARAVAATLAMRDALADLNTELDATLGVQLRIRIGVHTGPVVTGTEISARQALVSGQTVNVAARLQAQAEPGEILLGPLTREAAGPMARVEAAGARVLKGVQDPVPAYRLLGSGDDAPELRRRFDVPFVGRAASLALLDEALAAGPGLVTVYGDPGIGKTRLVQEWLSRPVLYGMGRCRPYGESGSLAPLADAVRGLFSGSSPVLEAGLLRDGTPGPDLDATCAALVQLLESLAVTPLASTRRGCGQGSAHRSCGRDSTHRGCGRRGENVVAGCLTRPHPERVGVGSGSTDDHDSKIRPEPVVLVLDDCQWAADPLLDVLERLAGSALVLCLGRHELLERRPQWTAGAIELPGLSDDECAAIAGTLAEVSAHSAGPGLARLAGGNPFFLEQLYAAAASGMADDELPHSLQALIGARVDALPPADRTTCESAAVWGTEFTAAQVAALLEAEADPSLGRLAQRQMIDALPVAYRFRNALIRTAVYQAMAKRTRADRHEKAALVAGSAASAGAHLEQAYELRLSLGTASDELRLRAAGLLASAGSAALTRSDLAWAENLLGRARHLLSITDPGGPAVLRQLGEVRLALGHADGQELLATVVAAAGDGDHAAGNDVSPGSVVSSGIAVEAAHARLGLAVAKGQPVDEIATVARRVLPVFRAAGDQLGQARARIRSAQARQLHGRHGFAVTLLELGLSHATAGRAEPEQALALGAFGVSLWRGPTPVPVAVARCQELLDEYGVSRPAVRVTLGCPLAVLLALDGRADEARELLSSAARIAAELGYAEARIAVPRFAAAAALDPAEALHQTDLAAAAAVRLGAGIVGSIEREAVRCLLDLGRPAAAARRLPAAGPTPLPRADQADLDGLRARLTAARAFPPAQHPGQAASPAHPGQAASPERASEAARALARRAVEAAAATDSPLVQANAALDQAETLLLLGLPGRAKAAAEQARRRFEAKQYRPGAAYARELARRGETT